MESSRNDVWNQSEGKYTCGDDMHATRDYRRLTAITCQSFGLDRKKQVSRLAFFLAPRTKRLRLVQRTLKNLGLRQRLATTEHPHSRKPIQVCQANL